MDLWLLVTVVVTGIVLVVGLVHFTGGSKAVPMEGKSQAATLYAQRTGDKTRIRWCGLTEDGLHALLETETGILAIVRSAGRVANARAIETGEIRELGLGSDGFTVTVKLAGLGWPKMRLVFDDRGTARFAHDLLAARMASVAVPA